MKNAKENPFKVGDILLSVYHYSMTIPSWYKVVKVTAKSVVIRELEKRMVSDYGYGQQGYEMPTEEFSGREMRRIVKESKRGACVDIDSECFATGLARIWDGNPVWADYLN